MENQHRLIKGYRDLSQKEIDLINRVKDLEKDFLEVQQQIVEHIRSNADLSRPEHTEKTYQFDVAEPMRWAAIGRTDLQTGCMALIRAVAKPE